MIITPVKVLILFFIGLCYAQETGPSFKIIDSEHIDAVERFRSYLQIKTVHPKVDYGPAITFLKSHCERIGIECRVLEFVEGKPHMIMKWTGRNSSLKSVMLNSHMDVVPVNREKWNTDPFEAYWDQTTQNIYARGSQDMKCVGMQYLEAIDRLKNKYKFTPERNIYITFVPEEEVGGHEGGMDNLVNSEYFTDMNVGLGLDEGLASPNEAMQVYYGERIALWGFIEATGSVGHGSSFIDNTCTEKITRVLDRIFEFRRSQQQELRLRPSKKSGEVVTINVSSMKAGYTKDCGQTFQMNVIPRTARVGFDMRVTPQVPVEQIEALLKEWTKEEGVNYSWVQYTREHFTTQLNDDKVVTLLDALKNANVTYETAIFPASTDARFLRAKKIPVIGFSPINHTPILLHDHNEYLNANIYLKGIEIYEHIIKALGQ